jgi:hypothetical protein
MNRIQLILKKLRITISTAGTSEILLRSERALGNLSGNKRAGDIENLSARRLYRRRAEIQ